MLSAEDCWSPSLLATLSHLGITFVDRPFDDAVTPLLAALLPDIVVLVCNLESLSHREIIKRSLRDNVSVLLVVDLGTSAAGPIAALTSGADAVLSAAADGPMMSATVTSLLRRGPKVDDERPAPLRAQIGGLTIDSDTHEIRDSGYLVPLTPIEYKITEYLARNLDGPHTPSELMSVAHGKHYNDYESRNAVRGYVRRIRGKLNKNQSLSVAIVNARKLGYRMTLSH
ncbi:MAG: winged helix-turn-helix domain-containing protein [bacterium]